MNISVTLSPKTGLEKALKNAGVKDPAKVTHLTIFGKIIPPDFWYIKNMAKTLQKLDMGKATAEGNGLDMQAFKGFTS